MLKNLKFVKRGLLSDIYEICVAIPDPLTDKLYAAVKSALERHATTQYEVTFIFTFVEKNKVRYDKQTIVY